MAKRFRLLLFAALCACLAPGIAATAPSPPELSARELLGTPAVDAAGALLGEVDGFVLDQLSGTVRDAVVRELTREVTPLGPLRFTPQRSEGPLVLDALRAVPPVASRLPRLRPVAGPYDSVVPGNLGMTVRHGQNGVVVSALKDGGPAAKAGVKVGDAVLRYNGEAVVDAEQFNRLVHDTRPGTVAKLELARNGVAKPLLVEIPVRQLDLTPRA